MVRATLFRFVFASVLVSVPPVPAVAAPAQQSLTPEPICIPWILCHPLNPGSLTVTNATGAPTNIELKSWSWGKANSAGVQPRLSSDPEEGGEIAARTVRKSSKPTISEMTVTKKSDVASTTLSRSASAGPAEPPPSGILTIVAAKGSCATGTHIPEVKLTARGRVYTLRDVDVVACADSGGNTDTCTLSYKSVAG